jgi:glycine/D-amino acid oxidase-like deaminating enzyme
VLFEAGLVGDGASGRTGGLVLEGTAAGILDDVEDCVPRLRRLVEHENIECDLSLPGCWEIAHRSAGARILPWTDEGHPVHIARTVTGGWVQPAALTAGIAEAAVRAGAAVCERSAVSRIGFSPELSLETGARKFTPGRVVVATNAWINATLPGAPSLHTSLTFACVTNPLDTAALSAIGLDEGIPFYTSDLPYLWGRTIRDGRVIFGAGLVFGSAPELDRTRVNEGSSRTVIDKLQQRIRGLHPALRNVQFESAWAGPIAFGESSVPLLGIYPGEPRVIVAGAYAGHGVALSVRAGELIALAIASNRPLPAWGSLVR